MSDQDANSPLRLKVAILGAGAMGSLFGGWLAEGGADVCLIDVNEAHLDAVNQVGLRLSTDGRDRRIRLRTGRPGEDCGRLDIVFVFTKTMHTRSALAASSHLLDGGATLVSLQNGLGNLEILSEFAPANRIVIGVTTYPADFHGPGHVSSHGGGKVKFMSADGGSPPKLLQLEAALKRAGVEAAVDPHVMVAIWEKVAFNAALNSICATTGRTVGEVGASEAGRTLVRAIVLETATVAKAGGITVDVDAILRSTEHALDHHLRHKPSMLQDVLARRPTEIASINGAIVAEAKRRGLETPVTDTLLKLVTIMEASNGVA